MRRTTTALLTVLLATGGLAACSDDKKSYEEITADCVQALKDRPKGDTGKPADCKDVKEDDYKTLLMSQVLEDTGMVKDGEVNVDELLEDAQP